MYTEGRGGTSARKQRVPFSALLFHFVVTAGGEASAQGKASAGFIGYNSVCIFVMKDCLSAHQCHGRFNKSRTPYMKA